MGVFRIHKNNDFTVMSKHHLRNKELSLKAKGLLTLMLSLPDEWDYSVLGLASLSKDGKDSIMSTLDELKRHGYLTMTMVRNDKGHIEGWTYDVFEQPNMENPDSEKPYAENPNTENPPQYNINNIDNINNIQNESNNVDNYSSRTNSTSNNNISTKERKKSKKEIDLSFCGIEFYDMMQRYIDYRIENGKPLVQSSAESAYRKLLKLSNGDARMADEIIEQSIANGWQGLFEIKQSKQQAHGNSSGTAPTFAQQFARTIKAAGSVC